MNEQVALFRKSVEALRDKAQATETRFAKVGGQLYADAVTRAATYAKVLNLLDSFTDKEDAPDEQ